MNLYLNRDADEDINSIWYIDHQNVGDKALFQVMAVCEEGDKICVFANSNKTYTVEQVAEFLNIINKGVKLEFIYSKQKQQSSRNYLDMLIATHIGKDTLINKNFMKYNILSNDKDFISLKDYGLNEGYDIEILNWDNTNGIHLKFEDIQ